MNAFFRKMSFASLAFGGLFLAACGDDSGSSSIDLQDSFDVVMAKANYEYDSKDSTLIVKKPVCKVGELDNLVWREEASDAQDTFKVYLDRSTAMMVEKGITEPKRYGYDGGKFPVGVWTASEKVTDKFQFGYRFEKKGTLNTVAHYSGACYAQDFKANLFSGNAATAQTERTLVEFYREFLPEDKMDASEESILKNIIADDCDRITLFDNLVSIEIDELRESSGDLTVAFKGKESSKECSLNFAFRYAIEEDDCNAAYEEFKADKSAEKFNFDDYAMKVEYDKWCIPELVLAMQRDQGIEPRKKTGSLNSSSQQFAKLIASIVASGMK